MGHIQYGRRIRQAGVRVWPLLRQFCVGSVSLGSARILTLAPMFYFQGDLIGDLQHPGGSLGVAGVTLMTGDCRRCDPSLWCTTLVWGICLGPLDSR